MSVKNNKCRNWIRMRIGNSNFMDGMAFYLVGCCSWIFRLGICCILCHPVHVKINNFIGSMPFGQYALCARQTVSPWVM